MSAINSCRAAPPGLTALSWAIDRVSGQLEGLSGSWAATPEEISGDLERMEEELGRLCAGDTEERAGSGPTQNPLLHHRMGDILRSELLERWRSSAAEGCEEQATGLLDVLWALERYQSRLWPEENADLRRRLADPDAFELVVGVAHDLRSPLNSILFLSEVLRSGQSGPVTPHQWSQLGLIYGATMGMISVANDIMDLARTREGRGEEEPSPFSIRRVFDSVHEMVRPIAEAKSIELTFDLPDYNHCTGRPSTIGRVLLNLTTNALKFTEAGGVKVGARRTDRAHVEFSVRDTGRGMNSEMQARLFHPFQRAARREGYFFAEAGLGLSIARRLVRAMGSDLTFESELGKGTVFSFTLELPPV